MASYRITKYATATTVFIGIAYLFMLMIEREYLNSQDVKIRIPVCKMNPSMEKQDYFIGAGCLIVQKNQILLIERPFTFANPFDYGKLAIPGGTAIRGEAAQCVAARETFEETGIEVEIVSIVKHFNNHFTLFECKPVKPITEDDLLYKKPFEVNGLQWVALDELLDKKLRFSWQFPDVIAWIKNKKNATTAAKPAPVIGKKTSEIS